MSDSLQGAGFGLCFESTVQLYLCWMEHVQKRRTVTPNLRLSSPDLTVNVMVCVVQIFLENWL